MKPETRQLFQRASQMANRAPGKNQKAETPWLRIENAASDEATIYIYGTITPYAWYDSEVSATDILDQLDSIKASTIHVRINSEGGSVFEGVAIYNLLREHDAKIHIHVDSLAASIASVIAMAGDVIEISEAASMMIHDPSTITWGTAEELRSTADVLDTLKEQIVAVYVRRTGKTADECRALMSSDTWMTGTQAVEEGFADVISEDAAAESQATQQPENNFKLNEPVEHKNLAPPSSDGDAETMPPISLRKAQATALNLN